MELKGGQKFEADKNYFGFGTLPHKAKIRARIRRRDGWMDYNIFKILCVWNYILYMMWIFVNVESEP